MKINHTNTANIIEVEIDRLISNPDADPRRIETNMDGLTTSLKKINLREYPMVKSSTNGTYMISDGHRRVAACRSLGFTHVPVMLVDDMTLEDIRNLNHAPSLKMPRRSEVASGLYLP